MNLDVNTKKIIFNQKEADKLLIKRKMLKEQKIFFIRVLKTVGLISLIIILWLIIK